MKAHAEIGIPQKDSAHQDWQRPGIAAGFAPRRCLLFSDVAVIGPFNGAPTFTIRVANKRHDLKLVRDRAPVLTLSWTIMHVIDESIYGRTRETLRDCVILVTFSGLNETMLHTIQAHKAYGAADIRWGKTFVNILSIAPDGERSIDYSRYHDVESITEERKPDMPVTTEAPSASEAARPGAQ